jgi:hypothetical protein
MYREMDMTYWLEKAEAEMAEFERYAAATHSPVVDPPHPLRYLR